VPRSFSLYNLTRRLKLLSRNLMLLNDLRNKIRLDKIALSHHPSDSNFLKPHEVNFSL